MMITDDQKTRMDTITQLCAFAATDDINEVERGVLLRAATMLAAPTVEGQVVIDKHSRDVINALLEVALRAAYLWDGAERNGGGYQISVNDYDSLENSLDAIVAMTDAECAMAPRVVSNARYALRHLLGEA